MINQSRLSQQTSLTNSRLAQDESKGIERSLGKLDNSELPSDGLLSGGILGNNTPAFAGTSSFNELLQMSKLDPKKEVVAAKTENKNQGDKKAENSERKTKSDVSGSKKTANKEVKSKNEKGEKDALQEQQTLVQLLALQQAQSLVAEKPHLEQMNKQPTKILDALKGQSAEQGNQIKQLEQPKNLTDVMKNLDQKIETLSQISNALQEKGSVAKPDELTELASKFDDVKFDFTQGQEQTGQQNALANSQLARELQTKEMMQKLAEQEWAQNDLTLRDLVSQQALQEASMEQIGLDRLEAMSRLKDVQIDKLQLQSLQNAAADKQLQLQDIQANKQPQWQSFRDLSPDQLAMVDALSGMKSDSSTSLNGKGNAIAGGTSIATRLVGNENNSLTAKSLTQDAIGNLQSLGGMNPDSKQGNSAGGNNFSSAGHSNRGDTPALPGVTNNRTESKKTDSSSDTVADKSDTRARESERTREMARSASLRAQSIASELAAKGGGTAKVQIKDSQLGVVELRINMSDNNRLNVELVANSERIKQELEKQSEDLKSGLEKHKVVLEGVKFATDTKLGDTGFQNSQQNDNRNQQQQQQQQPQQGFNSFSQNNSSGGQQGFGQDRFFEAPNIPLNTQAAVGGSVRKNYTGKNDAQTNVQRTANGSLKVIA
jgi:hypothetical protein